MSARLSLLDSPNLADLWVELGAIGANAWLHRTLPNDERCALVARALLTSIPEHVTSRGLGDDTAERSHYMGHFVTRLRHGTVRPGPRLADEGDPSFCARLATATDWSGDQSELLHLAHQVIAAALRVVEDRAALERSLAKEFA